MDGRPRHRFALMLGAAALTAVTGASLHADDPGRAPEVIDALASTEVGYIARRHLVAELVERGERGWMVVETTSRPGRGLSHRVVSEGGSERIRNKALKAVLDKEIEAACKQEQRRSALSSENYRVQVTAANDDAVRVQLTPLREDVRLVRGTALLDPTTRALVAVQGLLARHPSFWVRDVRIDKRYAQVAGVTLPVELVSTARIRLFGEARLRIRTEYLSVNGRPVAGALVARAAVPGP